MLRQNNTGLYGFPKPDLIGKNCALRQWRFKRKSSCFDLMRSQVDLSVLQ